MILPKFAKAFLVLAVLFLGWSVTADDGADKTARRPNVLIVGASSFNSPPFPLTELVGAMLESKGNQMNLEGKFPQLDAVSQMLSSDRFGIMSSWTLGILAGGQPESARRTFHQISQRRWLSS